MWMFGTLYISLGDIRYMPTQSKFALTTVFSFFRPLHQNLWAGAYVYIF